MLRSAIEIVVSAKDSARYVAQKRPWQISSASMADVVPSMPSPHKRSRSAVLKNLVMPGTRTPSPTKASPAKGHTRSQTVDVSTPSSRLDIQKHPALDHSQPHQPVLAERRENSGWKLNSPTKSPLKTGQNSKAIQRESERSTSPPKRRQPQHAPKEKENATPPSSGVTETRPPIWAQFATSSNECSLNSPTASSPNKDTQFPPRPQLDSRSPVTSGTKDFTKLKSSANSSLSSTNARSYGIWDEGSERPSSKSSASSMNSDKVGKVAAAVAMFNGKTCDSTRPPPFKQADLDKAFEAVLVGRAKSQP